MGRKNLLGLLAVIALVACSDATAATPRTEARAHDLVPNTTPTLGPPVIAVANARRVVPGLYVVSGMASDGSTVHLILRSSSLGFQTRDAGTLVHEEYQDSGTEVQVQVAAGLRYMLLAVPAPGGVDDMTHASYVEFAT